MPDQKTQTKENHRKVSPPFHFFFVPAILLLIVIAVYELFRHPGLVTAVQLLLVLVVAVAGFLARIYALKVQDRVIRLEERLRLSTLLPAHLLPAIYSLSERQLVALRFASDEEVLPLVERISAEKLDPKAIKAAIQKWRPDYLRV